MDGYGYISELPADLSMKFENTWIFHGNSMHVLTVVQLAHNSEKCYLNET